MRNLDLLNQLAYLVTKMQDLPSNYSTSPADRVSKLTEKLGELAKFSVARNEPRGETKSRLFEIAALCIMEIEEIDRLQAVRNEMELGRFDMHYLNELNPLDFTPKKDDENV